MIVNIIYEPLSDAIKRQISLHPALFLSPGSLQSSVGGRAKPKHSVESPLRRRGFRLNLTMNWPGFGVNYGHAGRERVWTLVWLDVWRIKHLLMVKTLENVYSPAVFSAS